MKELILEDIFFSVDNSKPQQLVYKSFKRSDLINTKLEYNRQYLLQLYENLECEGITINEVAKVKFKKNNLSDFFTHYNLCQGSISNSFDDARKRDLFKIKVRIGIGITNFNAVNKKIVS